MTNADLIAAFWYFPPKTVTKMLTADFFETDDFLLLLFIYFGGGGVFVFVCFLLSVSYFRSRSLQIWPYYL